MIIRKDSFKSRLVSLSAVFIFIAAIFILGDTGEVRAAELKRQMERLDRGLAAVQTDAGIYLTWRLFGTESLENQAFDIYRNEEKIAETSASGATCYTDAQGTASDTYIVVLKGQSTQGERPTAVWNRNKVQKNGSLVNSYTYLDVSFDRPQDGVIENQVVYNDAGAASLERQAYTYSANDMSVGDLDGDGDYELIVKWYPSNAKDNAQQGVTGNVYMDAYDVDYNTGASTRLWRIDLGANIRAGSHYTQFLVYDFDGDGKSELVLKTAPGSVDGQGNYVSDAGATSEIQNTDNAKLYYTRFATIDNVQYPLGTILEGPEYLTIFNGSTGAAMQTVDYDPPRNVADNWGDNYGNRSERYLATVAYLDGHTPSIVMFRGYYTYVYGAAYKWDGENLTQQWLHSSERNKSTVRYADRTIEENATIYGEGNHNLVSSDVDNDGCDEIVYGSGILDDDGTVLQYSGRGHGDALHVSDFDNDGQQEIFQVHEAGAGKTEAIPYAVDIRRYHEDVVLQPAVGDIGRGMMENVDDAYAAEHDKARSIFWSSAGNSAWDMKGQEVSTSRPTFYNFALYWDGDLSRELLDGNKLGKYSVEGGNTRFYFGHNLSYFPDSSPNNSTKSTPCLTADLLGDWREEVIFRRSDNSGVRIFMSTIATDYRLTTLMHDSQYRTAIAWQNVGYNQPPHTSYYIGSAALAKESDGTAKQYLEPETTFEEIEYPDSSQQPGTDDETPVIPDDDSQIPDDDSQISDENDGEKVSNTDTDTTKIVSNQKQNQKSKTKTGDETDMSGWILLCIVSGEIAIVALRKRIWYH